MKVDGSRQLSRLMAGLAGESYDRREAAVKGLLKQPRGEVGMRLKAARGKGFG